MKKACFLCLTAIVLLVASPFRPASSATWQEGADAYLRGDFAEALRIMTPLAEQGNANAQNSLGLLYFSGQGVEQDFATALALYYKAAVQGYARAQFNLGLAYEHGQGVTQDVARAFEWYRLAAHNGLEYAQINIGSMLAVGRGIERNIPEGYLWLEIAVRNLPPGSDRYKAELLRDKVARYLPLEQIDTLKAQAATWQPQPAQ